MAQFLDTAIQVKAVTDDKVVLERADGVGMEIPKSALASAMAGESDQWQLLLGNIGVRLALSGVKIEDDVAIKREIERVTFKVSR